MMEMLPGYRFQPSDAELIKHYLMYKIKFHGSRPNRIEAMKDVELYKNHPQTLAERYGKVDETEYWYFFTHRNRKNPHGKRPARVAADGFWKSTGANKPVLDLKKRVVGAKNVLVYMNGNHEKNYSKTKWVMHEFTTHLFPRPQTDANDMVLNEWVLCRIRNTGEGSVKDDEQEKEMMMRSARELEEEWEQEYGSKNIAIDLNEPPNHFSNNACCCSCHK